MITTDLYLLITIVFIFSIVQSIFGVGLLLFGTPTFRYKMIDDFKSPPEGDQFIIPKNKIIYNPAGFYENDWKEDLNEITSKLFSNDYNLRNYDNNIPKQTIKDKTHSTLINYL